MKLPPASQKLLIASSLKLPAQNENGPILPALPVPGPIVSELFYGLSSYLPVVSAESAVETHGSALSYADVAAYEATLGGQNVRSDSQGGFGGLNAHLGSKDFVPVDVGNSLILELDSSIVEDISEQLDDFSSLATIFRF